MRLEFRYDERNFREVRVDGATSAEHVAFLPVDAHDTEEVTALHEEDELDGVHAVVDREPSVPADDLLHGLDRLVRELALGPLPLALCVD